MNTNPDERIADLAGEVADGRPVDWDSLERDDPSLAPAVAGFRQIEALAAAYRSSDPPGPAAEASSAPALNVRTTLFEWGTIQVLEKLGEGGFAEVYRAWDPSLEREVALKLTRSDLESGATRIQRWIEEARRLARVRHPNVLVVHGVDVRDGRAGIWSDLIRGRTLERVLQEQGRLGEGEAILIGLDLCRALAAVHGAGLVHGDLKSTNVMREGASGHATAPGAGRIVLMDFGASGESSPYARRTTSVVTPLSSAPEVLRGDSATPVSDLYSLGVLLYRLVTGRNPIEATSWAELEGKILNGDRIPLRDVRPDLGTAFVAVVERGLHPDPARRFSSAGQMEQALRSARKEESEALPVSFGPSVAAIPAPSGTDSFSGRVGARRPERGPIALGRSALLIVALVAVGVVAAVLWRQFPPSPPNRTPVRFTIPQGDLHLALDPNHLAISPDGTMLAFAASDPTSDGDLWVRRLGDFQPRKLPGTKGARLPFWSPDGRSLGFISDGNLRHVRLDGGGGQVLCEANHPRGASWGKRGVIVFTPSPTGPLFQVSAAGGPVTPVTTLDSAAGEVAHRWPSFLPDGEHFLYTVVTRVEGPFEVRIGSIRGGRGRKLVETPSAPVYAHPDHLIYATDDAIVAQRFDAGRAQVRGEPFPIANPPAVTRTMGQGSPRVSVSRTGVLAWRPEGDPNSQLVWLDRNGQRRGVLGVRPDRWQLAKISPDGHHAILQQENGRNSDLWLLDLDHESTSRLTFQQARNQQPDWTPDGREIIYSSTREGGAPVLFRRAVDGPEADQAFYRSAASAKSACDWSIDRKWVLIAELTDQNGMDLVRVPVSGGPAIPYLSTVFNELNASFLPGGKWVLYSCNEEGPSLPYVQSFPIPGHKRQVSRIPILYMKLVNRGREILMICADRHVRSVTVEPGREPTFPPAHDLFAFPPDTRYLGATPDGKRFLMIEPAQRESPGISIATNWKGDR